ncbi:hypothetical protein D3C78_782760 [compost metagenome]
MQRHQLNLIRLFITLPTLHHIAQGKSGDDLGQRHWLINFGAFQHFGHPCKELVDVFHAHFRRFRARGRLIQPGFIVDAVNQIAHRGDRFTLGETLDFTQPLGKASQRFITAPGKQLAKTHVKARGEHAFVARHRPLTQLLQRRRTNFTLRCIHDTQERTVIIRIGEHAQISEEIFNLRTREKRRAARDFVRDAVLHQHLFKHPRLVVAAVKDRIVFVRRFIDEVMGNQLARHAFSLMLFVICAKHFEFRAVSQFGEKALFKNVGIIGDQDICRLQDPS